MTTTGAVTTYQCPSCGHQWVLRRALHPKSECPMCWRRLVTTRKRRQRKGGGRAPGWESPEPGSRGAE